MFHQLFKPTNATTLSLFRILFGALMLYQMIYYFKVDYIFQFMTGPEFLFSYPLTPFFVALPKGVLQILHLGLILSTVMIMVGWFYRYAMVYLFVVGTYFSFIDKTLYNNHLYLFSLLSFVMIFMEANAKYSFQPSRQKTVPAWNVYLLQFLIVLVYFYGGIAKLTPDWISGRIPLAMIADADKGMLSFLSEDVLLFLITYGGIAYDLLIGFMLLWKPTRWLGFALVLAFNLTNGLFLFDDIGVFPYFMVAATLLFFNPERVGKMMDKWLPLASASTSKEKKKQAKSTTSTVVSTTSELTHSQKRISIALVLFVVFHLLWPWRSHLFTSNPEWTGHGSRFAWHMKMQTKKVNSFKMTITDGPNGTPTEINYRSFLSVNQVSHLTDDPFLIVQFAKYLKEKAIRKGMAKDPIIKASIMVEFNKRPAQLYIDPNVDLTKVDESVWADYGWIMPLQPLK